MSGDHQKGENDLAMFLFHIYTPVFTVSLAKKKKKGSSCVLSIL